MPCGPAKTEQSGHNRPRSPEQALLITWVCARFLCQQKPTSGHDSIGTGGPGSFHVARTNDPPSGENRYVDCELRGSQTAYEIKRRLSAEEMTASLDPLRDQGIGAVSQGTACLIDRTDLMQHHHTSGPQRRNNVGAKTKEQHSGSNAGSDANLHMSAAHKRQKQVDGDRSVLGESACALDRNRETSRRK
jgi:hypothetical protein